MASGSVGAALKSRIVLPEARVSVFYDLSLKSIVFDPSFSFDGEVSILLNVIETTSSISLNGRDMHIRSAVLQIAGRVIHEWKEEVQVDEKVIHDTSFLGLWFCDLFLLIFLSESNAHFSFGLSISSRNSAGQLHDSLQRANSQ